MKKILIVLTILSVLLISGCGTLPQEVPSDFEFKHGWGACHAEWGWNSFEVGSDGVVEYKKMAGFYWTTKSFTLDNNELLELYQIVEKNNFFKLDETYHNENIIDGGCKNMEVKVNGLQHKVGVSNKKVIRFDRISDYVQSILDEKIPNWKELEPLKEGTCSELCADRGYTEYRCGGGPVIPGETGCNDDEVRIGEGSDCRYEEPVEGAFKTCCCK